MTPFKRPRHASPDYKPSVNRGVPPVPQASAPLPQEPPVATTTSTPEAPTSPVVDRPAIIFAPEPSTAPAPPPPPTPADLRAQARAVEEVETAAVKAGAAEGAEPAPTQAAEDTAHTSAAYANEAVITAAAPRTPLNTWPLAGKNSVASEPSAPSAPSPAASADASAPPMGFAAAAPTPCEPSPASPAASASSVSPISPASPEAAPETGDTGSTASLEAATPTGVATSATSPALPQADSSPAATSPHEADRLAPAHMVPDTATVPPTPTVLTVPAAPTISASSPLSAGTSTLMATYTTPAQRSAEETVPPPLRPRAFHPEHPVGRIPVTEVFPVVEDGRWPAKAVPGEVIPIRATVFREGHDCFGATAVLIRPDGTSGPSARMHEVSPGLDRYEARLAADSPGDWSFRVEGWSDPYATWEHAAQIKVPAGIDVALMLEEGARVLQRAAAVPGRPSADVALLESAIVTVRDESRTESDRLAAATSSEVKKALDRLPLRDFVSPSRAYPLQVDRRTALYGSWYEIFPRSLGSGADEHGQWHTGTLRSATEHLDRIAAMGFDVLYLTPISPIGSTNRKGRNNTLTARPEDPGSPYGIGSPDGGHDAIHPDLGTVEDFEALVARSRELGMEVALDLALQCSPDHPWVQEHPEWFTVLADGSIAFAENPPKKYQDIYPLNFDNDPEGIYDAVHDVIETWIERGVTIFRVDNPHTKPLTFWQRLLGQVHRDHPEVLFLAEAFTRPAMMRTLGKIGFQQSYTYFAWRNTKQELTDYTVELSQKTAHVLRPAFWPTTHDILTPFMTHGQVPAFKLRAVLAATLSPTWGIYSGYELAESVPRPGYEEQIDNEKYELKPRDFEAAKANGIEELLTRLNAARAAHPALQQLRDIWFHGTTDEALIAYSKRVDAAHSPTGQDDVVLTIVNLDPWAAHEGQVYLNLDQLGLGGRDGSQNVMRLIDELTGASFEWSACGFVRLDPFAGQAAHVLRVEAL
nr:maltotransferase domain-containing protein [Actinomyces trachealis]